VVGGETDGGVEGRGVTLARYASEVDRGEGGEDGK
jgi:hypothetical protein